MKKIYSLNGSTIIEAVGMYPKGTLIATQKGLNFAFSSQSGNDSNFLEFKIDWENIQNENGDGFATIEDVTTYLTTIL